MAQASSSLTKSIAMGGAMALMGACMALPWWSTEQVHLQLALVAFALCCVTPGAVAVWTAAIWRAQSCLREKDFGQYEQPKGLMPR